eukprot:GILK01015119.1.p1 GENE.GILK01015119.1~~GILK01015119.1.p1  ORF type:complete len:226 (-),score=26.15 GILK01015119.1:71-748(-)
MARASLVAFVVCLSIVARSVSANKVTVTYYPNKGCQGTPRVDTFALNQCVSMDFSIPVLFTRITQTLWANFHACDAAQVTATGWISNGASQCPANSGGDSLDRNTNQCYEEPAYPAGFSSSRYGCVIDTPPLTAVAAPEPAPTATPAATATPAPTATPEATPTPTAAPTPVPSAVPTAAPKSCDLSSGLSAFVNCAVDTSASNSITASPLLLIASLVTLLVARLL